MNANVMRMLTMSVPFDRAKNAYGKIQMRISPLTISNEPVPSHVRCTSRTCSWPPVLVITHCTSSGIETIVSSAACPLAVSRSSSSTRTSLSSSRGMSFPH
jgi:hypothetical protein